MVIVDDHLALLAISGRLPRLLDVEGPVVTTVGFHFRLARAVADSSRAGALSRRLGDAQPALRRVLHPPTDRLVILDPRVSMAEAIDVSTRHRANLLLAELIGAALHHRASIRVTTANLGRSWVPLMSAEAVDFGTIDL